MLNTESSSNSFLQYGQAIKNDILVEHLTQVN